MIDALNQNPAMLVALLLLFGLCIGSFLNVVIYRLPVMMQRQWRRDCCDLLDMENKDQEPPLNLAFPNSHCPRCQAPIKAWQNIPVVSYVILGGKCGNCKSAISLRYPLVELATGVLSVFLLLQFDASWGLLGALLLTWSLITLTMIDFDHKLLPDDVTLPLLWLGLALNTMNTYVDLQNAVMGAMLGYLSLWSVYWVFKLLTGKEGMGYGDFKLLAALGAWLGWQAVPLIILLSSVVGAVCGIAIMIAQRRGKDVPMPFGPYLAAAGWICLVWGDEIIVSYFGAAGI